MKNQSQVDDKRIPTVWSRESPVRLSLHRYCHFFTTELGNGHELLCMYGENSAITSYVSLVFEVYVSRNVVSGRFGTIYREGVKLGWYLKITRHFNAADTTFLKSGTTNNAIAMKWSVCILERFLLNNGQKIVRDIV